MAKPATRKQFKEYCLRRLGWPVIDINVDDEQVEDRIDDALSFFYDYHYDGTEKLFMKHRITQADIDRKWIYCPDPILFVTGVLRFDDSNSSINMFDLRYQLRLHDLYDFTSVSYVSYEITMQHIQTLNLLFSGTPQFRFNRMQNKVFLDIDWTRDVNVGDYVIIECYRAMKPDAITLTGTVSMVAGNTTVIGTGTIFDQEIAENDFVDFGGESLQVNKIKSPTEIILSTPPAATSPTASMTVVGLTDVWDNRFLKAYASAKIKMQWGSNMKKFGGIQMPGGVTLNGKEIYDEAEEEIGKLEEQIYNSTSMPSEIFIG
jgi:sporulation protein YlmC with PRC-barrel domain